VASKIDPYYRWLQIPPHEQPPHFYRLLGLSLFENHPDAIASAADQRMAFVRSAQNGPYAKESQALLNELAAAQSCLLDPISKANYDEQLRRHLAGKNSRWSSPTAADLVHPPPPAAIPVGAEFPESVGDDNARAPVTPLVSAGASVRRRSRSSLPLIVVSTSITVILFTAAAIGLWKWLEDSGEIGNVEPRRDNEGSTT
jgi:hypothetical protein